MASDMIVLSTGANVDGLFERLESMREVYNANHDLHPGMRIACDACVYWVPCRVFAILCHAVCLRVARAPCKKSRAELVRLVCAIVRAWQAPSVIRCAFEQSVGVTRVELECEPGPMTLALLAKIRDPVTWLYPVECDGPIVIVRLVTETDEVLHIPQAVLRASAVPWMTDAARPGESVECYEAEQFVTAIYAESATVRPGQSPRGDIRQTRGVFALAECLGLSDTMKASRAFAQTALDGQGPQLIRYLQEQPERTMGALAFVLCATFAILPGCSPWRARRALRILTLYEHAPVTDSELSPPELYAMDAVRAFYMAPGGMPESTDALVQFAVCASHAASLLMIELYAPADLSAAPPGGVFAAHGTYGECRIVPLEGGAELKSEVAHGSAKWFDPCATLWDSTDFWSAWQVDCADLVGIELPATWTPGFLHALGHVVGLANVPAYCTVAPAKNSGHVDWILVRRDHFVHTQLCIGLITGYGNAKAAVLPHMSLVDIVLDAFLQLDRLGDLAVHFESIQMAFFARLYYCQCGKMTAAGAPLGYVCKFERELVFRALVYCITCPTHPREFQLTLCIEALLCIQSTRKRTVLLPTDTAKMVGALLVRISEDPIAQRLCDFAAAGAAEGVVELSSDDIFGALCAIVPVIGIEPPVSSAVICDAIFRLAYAMAYVNMDDAHGFAGSSVSRATAITAGSTPRQLARDAVLVLCQRTRGDTVDKMDATPADTQEAQDRIARLHYLSEPLATRRDAGPDQKTGMMLLLRETSFVPRGPRAANVDVRFTHLGGVAFSTFTGLYSDNLHWREAYARSLSPERMDVVARTLDASPGDILSGLVPAFNARWTV